MKADLIDRLLEPDWHDPACPFLKHCYCDDGAPHDAVRHPLAREAADEIASLRARVEAMREALEGIAQHKRKFSSYQCQLMARSALKDTPVE